MNFEFIKDIPGFRGLLMTLFFILLFSPGMLIIFLFKHDLFSEMDTIKLLLVSIALTTPILVINFFTSIILENTNNRISKHNKENIQKLDFDTIMLNLLLYSYLFWIFVGLIIFYFIKLFNVSDYLFFISHLIIGLSIIILIISICQSISYNKKMQNK